MFAVLGGAGLVVGTVTVQAEQQRTQKALDQVTDEQEKTQAAWKQTRQTPTPNRRRDGGVVGQAGGAGREREGVFA